jgi:hypothetical protein
MTALEREVMELKTRVEQLEQEVRRMAEEGKGGALRQPGQPQSLPEVLARLKSEGSIVELPPEAREQAAHWQALSEEEREAHIRLMRSLTLNVPLSQIVIDNRRCTSTSGPMSRQRLTMSRDYRLAQIQQVITAEGEAEEDGPR